MNYKATMVGSKTTSLKATSGVPSLEEIQYVSQPILVVSLTKSSLQIAIHKLNGKNYLEWSQSVHLVIDRKGKLGYLIGEVKPLAANDPNRKQWR